MKFLIALLLIIAPTLSIAAEQTAPLPVQSCKAHIPFGMPGFDELYLKYEKSKTPKKKIRARDLFVNILKERAETGKLMNRSADTSNNWSR